MTNARKPLRINVGFILHEEVGYNYEFLFDIPHAILGSDLELRDLSGTLSVGRTTQGLLLAGDFQAHTGLTCVRCLSAFSQKLTCRLTEVYAIDDRSVTESGLLVPEDAHLDLEPLVRDYALLEIPMSPICRQECRGLCVVCGQDLNIEDCGHRPDASSSPFAALQDFIR